MFEKFHFLNDFQSFLFPLRIFSLDSECLWSLFHVLSLSDWYYIWVCSRSCFVSCSPSPNSIPKLEPTIWISPQLHLVVWVPQTSSLMTFCCGRRWFFIWHNRFLDQFQFRSSLNKAFRVRRFSQSNSSICDSNTDLATSNGYNSADETRENRLSNSEPPNLKSNQRSISVSA